jgi:RimJ/RimL family protein N-acetyltransferase
LATGPDADQFRELYELYVRPNYPETDDYVNFVLNVHQKGADEFGYFTKKKTIWTLSETNKSIGYTVVTEKRGGCIKFGPTVIVPDRRGDGYGTAFRLLVEKQYPQARKAYNTLPDDNLAALKYVLKAGYQIEAHLREQYRVGAGELVVGKLLDSPTTPPLLPNRPMIRGRVYVTSGRDLDQATLQQATTDLLSDYYSALDPGFVSGLIKGMQGPFSLSRKSKQVFLAIRADHPVGLLIVTPKRGGAVKCAPLIVRGDDEESFRLLLDAADQAFPDRPNRRFYLQLPLYSPVLIALARTLGYEIEGVLREPYRRGVDLLALGRSRN